MAVNQQFSAPAHGLVNLDQYYPNVSLLLHFDGSNGSTTFTDSSIYPKTASGVGNAQISTAQSKFGGSSLFLDGTGDYLTIGSDTSLVFGTGDLTVECWLYQTAATSFNLFTFASQQWCVYYAAGTSSLRFYDGTTDRITGGSVTLNTWTHIALSRRSGVVRLYINGTQTGLTYTESVIANLGAGTTYIGYYPADVSVTGYIDEFRATKGVARYTSNFNPPGAPFPDNSYNKFYSDPDYSSVSLLLHGDGSNGGLTFTDNSRFTRTPSAISNAVTSTTQKKFGVASIYTPAVTANQLRYASSSDFNISGVDFTIELWFYRTGGQTALVCRRDPGISGFTSGWVLNTNGIRANINGVWSDTQITWADPGLNTWNHIAWTVSGTTMRVFLNGVLAGTKTSVTSINDTAATLDFAQSAAGGENLYQGFIDDFRFTRGVARYTSNFTPPAAPHPNLGVQSNWIDNIYADQYYGNTVVLLHCDGANSGTTFIDSSAQRNAVTNTSAVTSSTVVKWGSTSGFFNAPALLEMSNTVFTFPGDFTVELWLYLSTSTASNQDIVTLGTESSGRYVWFINSGVLKSNLFGSGSIPTYGTLNLTTWYHLAFVRAGSTITVYINGVSGGTDTQAGTLGSNSYVKTMSGVNGYIDDLRITKGVARYTAAFTPPAAPFPNLAPPGYDPFYQRTSLLLHMDGANGGTTFTDNSPTPKTVTPVGTAQTSTSIVKYGSASAYFPGGINNYLTVTTGEEFNFGLADFTIECWAYVINYAAERAILYKYVTWTANIDFALRVDQTTGLVRFVAGDGALLGILSDSAITQNVWVHIAVTRSAGTTRMFINGIMQTATSTVSTSIPNDSNTLYIGTYDGFNSAYYGYIDDLRITKGIARYTANFQPPTGPFPNR